MYSLRDTKAKTYDVFSEMSESQIKSMFSFESSRPEFCNDETLADTKIANERKHAVLKPFPQRTTYPTKSCALSILHYLFTSTMLDFSIAISTVEASCFYIKTKTSNNAQHGTIARSLFAKKPFNNVRISLVLY